MFIKDRQEGNLKPASLSKHHKGPQSYEIIEFNSKEMDYILLRKDPRNKEYGRCSSEQNCCKWME